MREAIPDHQMRKLTGAFATASVVIWLAIFPLYMAQSHPGSAYSDADALRVVAGLENVFLTRILLSLCLYVTLMIFTAGFRELARRAVPEHDWIGSLLVAAMAIWIGVSMVANGLEGGIALESKGLGDADPTVIRTLTMGYLLIYNGSIAFAVTGAFLAAAGYITLATDIAPKWTAWLAFAGALLCCVAIPAMYAGPVRYGGFYNAGGWGPAVVANFPPLVWFAGMGWVLIRTKRGDQRSD